MAIKVMFITNLNNTTTKPLNQNKMGDYTQTESFWKRLLSFESDVQTGCAMGEEEKEMIFMG